MTNINKENIAGLTNKTWKLHLLTVNHFDSLSGESTRKTIQNFESPDFISEWGGYAPIQLIFFNNHDFRAVYQIDGTTVEGGGSWQIVPNGIVLKQNSGDDILLTNSSLQNNVLSAGYEYLSSDYGINKLEFKQSN